MKKAHRAIAALLILASVLTAPSARAAEGKKTVNINTADSTQLVLLPRVGQSLAQRILDYRKENGPFKQTEDLMLVGGIGQKMFEALKPYVSLSGPTTLEEKPKGSRSRSKSGSKAKSGSKSTPKPVTKSVSKPAAAKAVSKSGSKKAAKASRKQLSH
jgi:competence protein ComEA